MVQTPTVRRNEPCPCRAGKKFKHCHSRAAGPTAGPPAT
ncbi:MAG: SEC-C metal-binding domain-containing protein [Acidimicrobiia bacterium]